MNTLKTNAVVYCQGAFNTPNGKTAHGLVRFTERYRVLSVIDSRYEGRDSGEVLDGRPNGIPLLGSLEQAVRHAEGKQLVIRDFVVGLAPDGGRLPDDAVAVLKEALGAGLNLVSGLHDYLSENPELVIR